MFAVQAIPLQLPWYCCEAAAHRVQDELRHLVGGQRRLHGRAAAVVGWQARGGVAVVPGVQGQGLCGGHGVQQAGLTRARQPLPPWRAATHGGRRGQGGVGRTPAARIQRSLIIRKCPNASRPNAKSGRAAGALAGGRGTPPRRLGSWRRRLTGSDAQRQGAGRQGQQRELHRICLLGGAWEGARCQPRGEACSRVRHAGTRLRRQRGAGRGWRIVHACAAEAQRNAGGGWQSPASLDGPARSRSTDLLQGGRVTLQMLLQEPPNDWGPTE